MPTLGDLLHMDEDGRFTTSGTGASLVEEFDRRSSEAELNDALERLKRSTEAHAHAGNEDDQVKVVDSSGGLCGYYSLWQTWDMPENLRYRDKTVSIDDSITKARRIALLRRSYDNPFLTPQHNREVSELIDSLLHPYAVRQEQAKAGSPSLDQRLPQAKRTLSEEESRDEPDLLVTRDRNGLFLGLFTVDDARLRWPKARRVDEVIYVNTTVIFARAAATAAINTARQPRQSDRVFLALRQARVFVNDTTKGQNAKSYWRGKSHCAYSVYHDSDDPICCVPYSTLEPAFGLDWIVIGPFQVQLLVQWSDQEASERSDRAMELAKEKYYEVATVPGAPSLTEKQFNRRVRKNSIAAVELSDEQYYEVATVPGESSLTEERHIVWEHREARSGKSGMSPARANPAQGRQEWVIRYAARDEEGLFLGVFSMDEALALWPDCKLSKAIIVVPHTITFAEAAAAMTNVVSFRTTFSMAQHKNAITQASKLPEALLGQDPQQFWASLHGKKLDVRNNSKEVIARLTPAELAKAFDTGWFLVSTEEAQVMMQMAAGAIAVRARMATEAAGRAPSRGKTAGDSQAPGTREPSAKSRPQATPAQIMLAVGVSQSHARVIMEQIRLTAQYGFRTKLTEMIRQAFPGDAAELPSGTSMSPFHIAGILAGTGQHSLPETDVAHVLMAMDDAMTCAEQREEDAKAEYERLLERAQKHKHEVVKWAESVEADPTATPPERELAKVFSERRGTVLIMPDSELYRSVLNTEMDEEAYRSALHLMPFTHFIVRTPRIAGVYGFGVVADDDRHSAVLVPIPDGKDKVVDEIRLERYFKRVLFFICANRDFLGMGGGSTRERNSSPRSGNTTKKRLTAKEDDPVKRIDKPIVKGRQLDIGMRMVFLMDGPGFKSTNISSRDIRPHAVAGSRYVNKFGTVVVRKPHWNHGAGRKRNLIPPEIVERNIKYHGTRW